MARSRVAPKRQQSVPSLELCAALAGAQLAKLVRDELTLSINQTILWTDSMTVLEWIQSDSCRYKVFVGTRVTEIQELTDHSSWRYVNTQDNPADDITRGKTLQSLAEPSRWSQGPPFLKQSPEHWPKRPEIAQSEVVSELKGLTCYSVMAVETESNLPDVTQYKTWRDLVGATLQACQGAASSNNVIMTNREAEAVLLRACQAQSFPEEVAALQAQKLIPVHSRLVNLAPEWDPLTNMIRVGGRLRRLANSDPEQIHPIVLDPRHAVTKLLIQEFDERLLHPGAERVYAEIRRQYWILRGRQAIKHHQLHCQSCQRWRAQPKVPQMADLPPERLRLLCPPFYSTGVDCFGPYLVKIGRRNEKRWGLIFKCLTTRAVHIELLNSMDVDAFLLALRRLIARRGQPREIRSDCGTNFRGAERELREAFFSMESELQIRLADHQIDFKFNPPSAPHFGGIWEREVRSIKNALQVAVGNQAVTEDVLSTILVEVEGILNSKPLGYASTDVADIDPITPNLLLMGRRDASLPQVAYAPGDMGRRRWRHCQNMADQFWLQFTRNYLPTLQTRQKWHKASGNLEVDSVVLIVDPQLPRAQWPIGRVRKTLPGSDGCVRTVEVVIDGKAYIRPVARLIQLPALEGNTKDS
jgi:transposase InsO family protein